MKNSGFLNLNWKDLIKGLIVVVLTAILTGVYEGLQGGGFTFTWEYFKPIVTAGAIAGIGYLLKNWLTNSDDKFLKKEE